MRSQVMWTKNAFACAQMHLSNFHSLVKINNSNNNIGMYFLLVYPSIYCVTTIRNLYSSVSQSSPKLPLKTNSFDFWDKLVEHNIYTDFKSLFGMQQRVSGIKKIIQMREKDTMRFNILFIKSKILTFSAFCR